MSTLFDFKTKTSDFAVMGNPVAHSRSPQIHTLFAEQCGVSLNYKKIQVDSGGFEQAVSHFFAHGGAGLNVTLPYKSEAWQLCNLATNSCSLRAAKAQAVNTIKVQENSAIYGDNTDGVGLVADLECNLKVNLHDINILIIGAGGAVKGILQPLISARPKRIQIFNRTPSKAIALVNYFGQPVLACDASFDLGRAFDLIINASSASLSGKLPDLKSFWVDKKTVAYDLMYSNQPTLFMKWCLDHGVLNTHDGLGMLVEQAAASFKLWHNKTPKSQAVIQALRKY